VLLVGALINTAAGNELTIVHLEEYINSVVLTGWERVCRPEATHKAQSRPELKKVGGFPTFQHQRAQRAV
jgi:hypothetical protein